MYIQPCRPWGCSHLHGMSEQVNNLQSVDVCIVLYEPSRGLTREMYNATGDCIASICCNDLSCNTNTNTNTNTNRMSQVIVLPAFAVMTCLAISSAV